MVIHSITFLLFNVNNKNIYFRVQVCSGLCVFGDGVGRYFDNILSNLMYLCHSDSHHFFWVHLHFTRSNVHYSWSPSLFFLQVFIPLTLIPILTSLHLKRISWFEHKLLSPTLSHPSHSSICRIFTAMLYLLMLLLYTVPNHDPSNMSMLPNYVNLSPFPYN